MLPESDFETKANIDAVETLLPMSEYQQQMKDTLVYSSIATIW